MNLSNKPQPFDWPARVSQQNDLSSLYQKDELLRDDPPPRYPRTLFQPESSYYKPRYLIDDDDEDFGGNHESYRPQKPPGARDQRTDLFRRIARDDKEPPRGSTSDVINRSMVRLARSSPVPHRTRRVREASPSEMAFASVQEPPDPPGYDPLSGTTVLHRVYRPTADVRRMPIPRSPQTWDRSDVQHGLTMYKLGMMDMGQLERSWLQPSRKSHHRP